MTDEYMFSVITVCWNVASEIERTLKSVAGQKDAGFEYIVIDGGSTDGTLSVIEQYRDKVDVLVSEKDKGIYNAMNKGLRLAHGRYAIFMNAGDCFASDDVLAKVKSQVEASLHAKGENVTESRMEYPALVYGDYMRVDGEEASQVIPARSASKAWYGMFASHQSMFYNVDFLRQNDLEYDESYRIAADYKLTLEVVKRAGLSRVQQVPVCIARFDLGGVSHANQDKGLNEADRVRKEVLEMGGIKRLGIRIMQRCARPLRENKVFKAIYSRLRY